MSDRGEEVFCHSCCDTFFRIEFGLKCPYCGSEATEIVTLASDPSSSSSSQRAHESDLNDFHPQIEDPTIIEDQPEPPRPGRRLADGERSRSSASPLADYNPWPGMDTEFHELGNGGGMTRSYRLPHGRITFTSTFTSTTLSSGRRLGLPYDLDLAEDSFTPMLQIFRSVTDTFLNEGYRDTPRGDRSPRSAESDTMHPGEGDQGAQTFATGGLWPRDADNPQPLSHPLGNITEILSSNLSRSDFPDGPDRRSRGGGGIRVMTGPNPLSIIANLLGRHADAVYSQEELDRVISQLIDQNINGNAPPPASQSAIQSLPKRNVDKDMLGNDGKAECSICMDAVEMGSEVAVLPCKHWFHFSCIEMWLNQHNTCPHCRRGINNTPEQEGSAGTRDNPLVIPSSPELPIQPRFRPDNNQGEPVARRRRRSTSHREPDVEQPERRRSGRNEGQSGGFTGWVRSRLGGS